MRPQPPALFENHPSPDMLEGWDARAGVAMPGPGAVAGAHDDAQGSSGRASRLQKLAERLEP